MTSDNFHVSYPDVNRYWSPVCEDYAGGDALLTAMSKGWTVSPTVYEEEFWLAGMRLVVVLHFELVRGGRTMKMPVISNPFVRRLTSFEKVAIEPIADQAPHARRSRDADTVS
ncbi:MAG: hypothetical protein IH587_13930 [Anaerolineae bacterium]|nr:hypothetical protein [Anaerolineae bacterium]